jgi:nicotinamide mononucleotide transporter
MFAEAFVLWGSPTTWLEIVAFVLALAMVGCNIREIHWGWPLAAISSVLYVALFWQNKLYGDAALQVFFALVALWGWGQWLRGRRDDGSALAISRLTRSARLWTLASCAVLWPATGLFLKTYTDTDVPWWDAFPTAVSIVGQFLLAASTSKTGPYGWRSTWSAWACLPGKACGSRHCSMGCSRR